MKQQSIQENRKQIKYEKEKQKQLVHDFTGSLNQDTLKMLANGPNFIPTITQNKHDMKLECKNAILTTLHKYAGSIAGSNTYSHNSNMAISLNLNHPNFTGNKLMYMIDILEKVDTLKDYQLRYRNSCSNMTQSEFNIIRKLAEDNDIIINTADKNLGFSINHVQWYTNEYKRQLSDKQVYENIPIQEQRNIITKGHRDLMELHQKYQNTENVKNYNIDILQNRTIDNIKLPTLNIMPKVHKLSEQASQNNEHLVKGRHIVNGLATLNTEPSKLLGEMLQKQLDNLINLFQEKSIHCPLVNSSRQVIERLNKVHLKAANLDNIYFISFDFASLYTSIKKWTIFNTIHFLGSILNLNRNEITLMKDLFSFIKQNAYFTVGNRKLYLQKDGLAMGSYHSSQSANLVLLKAEYYMLQRKCIASKLMEFFRFIDDGSMIVVLNSNEITDFVTKITAFYPKELEIEFQINKFRTVFLDLNYGLGEDSYTKGQLHYKVHQKPFNAYAYLNFNSNHPFGVFKGIIKTECHRYHYLTSNERQYMHMCKLFQIRLMKCGYKKAFLRKHIIQYETLKRRKKNEKIQENKPIRCRVNFNKLLNQGQLYKYIFENKYTNVRNINTCNATGSKLKTLLLTKKRLHKKLEKFM